MNPIPCKTLILTGPTAVGKSALALEVAKRNSKIEIVNGDSVAVYQHFNIGTAKPSLEERKICPHHVLDCIDPNTVFTAARFYEQAVRAVQEIHARGNLPLVVGGSGLYLKALLFGLWNAPGKDEALRTQLEATEPMQLFLQLQKIDPISAERIGPTDHYRLVRSLEIFYLTGKTPTEHQESMPTVQNPNVKLWLVERDKNELEDRLRQRIQAMLQNGWVDEVQQLKQDFPNSRVHQASGYFEVNQYLDGIAPNGRKPMKTLKDLEEEIFLSHRHLVKAQRTWFKTSKPEQTFVLPQEFETCVEKVLQFFL